MHQQVQQVERRPRARKRRSDDGLANTVKRILSLNLGSFIVGLVGFLCIALPMAFGLAGTAFWPLVIAYGGCLVGIALSRTVS